MRLISDTPEPVRVLALGGEIDLHFAPVLRALLEQRSAVPVKALVLDLSEVTFIDSSGIAAIIERLRSATRQGSAFCVGGMSEPVQQVFEIIALQKAMPLYVTREEALKSLEQKKVGKSQKPLFAAA